MNNILLVVVLLCSLQMVFAGKIILFSITQLKLKNIFTSVEVQTSWIVFMKLIS